MIPSAMCDIFIDQLHVICEPLMDFEASHGIHWQLGVAVTSVLKLADILALARLSDLNGELRWCLPWAILYACAELAIRDDDVLYTFRNISDS